MLLQGSVMQPQMLPAMLQAQLVLRWVLLFTQQRQSWIQQRTLPMLLQKQLHMLLPRHWGQLLEVCRQWRVGQLQQLGRL
jgi:hypothetical protein